jgi:hypothetical protein
MWHRVEVVLTDVSEERIASIFRVEGKIRISAREATYSETRNNSNFDQITSTTGSKKKVKLSLY